MVVFMGKTKIENISTKKSATKRITIHKILFIAVLLLFITTIVSTATTAQGTTVIANTNEWESIYLLSTYANSINASFVFFKDPSDAQLKEKLIPTDNTILTFESDTKAVLKSFCNYLKADGFNNVETTAFHNYKDLQKTLIKKEQPQTIFVFSTDYAVEPILATPYLLQHKVAPAFYEENIEKELGTQHKYVYIGRIPVRKIPSEQSKTSFNTNSNAFSDVKNILGMPDVTSKELLDLVLKYNTKKTGWGEIMQPKETDFEAFIPQQPIFLHYNNNYDGYLLKAIQNSDIKKFEVIGGALADFAKTLEQKSGEDLDFMVKYGRRITNYAPYENQVLALNTIELPFPQEQLIVKNTTYYPEENIIAIRFKNSGNTDVYLFSTANYGGLAIADEEKHIIKAGTEKTIPYELPEQPTNKKLQLISSYAFTEPLKNKIIGGDGTTDYEVTVQDEANAQPVTIELHDAELNTKTGDVYLNIKNKEGKPIRIYGELTLPNGNIRTSQLEEIPANSKKDIVVSFPYTSNEELLGKTAKLRLYYGVKDTVHEIQKDVVIQEKTLFFIDSWPYMIAILLLMFFTVLYFIFAVRRRKDKENKNCKDKKTQGELRGGKQREDKQRRKNLSKKSTKKSSKK